MGTWDSPPLCCIGINHKLHEVQVPPPFSCVLFVHICWGLAGLSENQNWLPQQATTPTLLAVMPFFLRRCHVLLKLYVTVCSYSLSDTSVVMHSTGIKDDLLLIVQAN